MRWIIALVALCSMAAHAALEPAPDLHSDAFGFGPGLVLQEVTHEPDRSLFRILRSYDGSTDPGTAWGTPQNWFIVCAISSLAGERGSNQFHFEMEIGDPGALRPMRPSEQFSSVPVDKLYMRVDWQDASGGDPDELLRKFIFPVNDQTKRFCANIRSRARS